MAIAKNTNIGIGTVLIRKRNCTDSWYKHQMVTVIFIESTNGYVYVNEHNTDKVLSFPLTDIMDFDIFDEEHDVVATMDNIRVGTILVSHRHCTESWYYGRMVIVSELSDDGWVYLTDLKTNTRLSLSFRFINDFDIVPTHKNSEAPQSLREILASTVDEINKKESELADLREKSTALKNLISMFK